MKLRGALVAATMLALPVAANAQAVNGIYVGAGVGVNILQQETVKSVPGFANVSGQFGSTVGPALVMSLGYGFGNGLRAEIEASYRYNSLNSLSGFGVTSTGGGREQKVGGMVNVLYDFVGLSSMIQPYVGAGVGYQAQILQNGYGASTLGRTTINSGSQGGFAYQVILGGAMPIASIPGLALTADFRFMGMTGERSYATTIRPSVGPVVNTNIKLNDQYNYSVLLGVRYNFGQAPAPVPAPAPAPAAAPARSFLVFFDWDKYNLTDRARAVIKDAAATSKSVAHTRIEVNGYADTSGNPKYNMGLSMRRAQNVAAELVRNGVDKKEIAIKAFGDTVLLVPTGPGVREPQNRRVEIIIK